MDLKHLKTVYRELRENLKCVLIKFRNSPFNVKLAANLTRYYPALFVS